jgi:hypothetical protein
MNVFIVSQGQDTGGQAQRTAAAFKRWAPDWTVRAMCATETYIQFPVDLRWDFSRARQLYARADVVHHMNWLYGYAMYDRTGKPAVVHHHGPPLRDHADEVNAEARSVGAVQVVATVDLLEQAPHAEWLPAFYDLDWMRRTFPRTRPTDGKLRIGHGPTVRAAKGTDAILAALDRVSQRIPSIEVELIEGVTWHESLRRKAQCDIWIDQITLGYGGSAIEAMALGVPTISGWEEPRHWSIFMEETRKQSLPFMLAGDGADRDIEEAIEVMVTDSAWRSTYRAAGQQFVDEFHSERRGVEQLQRIYASAKPTRGVDALELWNGPEMKEAAIRKWATR